MKASSSLNSRSTTGIDLSIKPRGKASAAVLILLMVMAAQQCLADCTVSATAVSFGSYDVFSGTPLDGAGSVDASCSPSASYTISLNPGGGTFTQREMLSGAVILDYNLYTSAARSVVWGDGTGATATVNGSGTSGNHTVYGRIPDSQNKPAGSYSDTIIVTITF